MLEFRLLPNGRLVYLQYINYHRDPPVYGPLIRVLPGQYECRPNDISHVARKQELFVAFVPVTFRSYMEELRIVGNEPIPERLDGKWPLFKAYNEHWETGVRTWWLWDGKKSWEIGRLPAQYYDLPPEEIIDLKVLEDRIIAGWRPRDEVRPRDKKPG